MRCSSVHRRLTSEDRRLSTHLAFLPERSLRRARGCGCLSVELGAPSFWESSLMAFTVHVDLSSTDKDGALYVAPECGYRGIYRAISGDAPGDRWSRSGFARLTNEGMVAIF